MAPKKKKGKKGKKGKEEPEPEDHYMTMKGDQLEITIANLKEKLQDAKIKRNMVFDQIVTQQQADLRAHYFILSFGVLKCRCCF